MQVQVGVALRAGLLTKTPEGAYKYDEEQIAKDLAPLQEQQVKQPAREFLEDKGAENLVETIARDVSPMSAIGVINGLVEDGEVNPSLMGSVASELGVYPARSPGYVQRIVNGFQAQADADAVVERLTGGLVEAADLYAWARQNDGDGLKEAMRTQITQRSTSGFKALATNYMKGLDKHQPQIVMDAAHKAGLSPRWDASAKVVVPIFPMVVATVIANASRWASSTSARPAERGE